MGLRLSEAQVEAIRRHGARDYPSECCGVLLGKVDGESKHVTEIVALKNLRHDARRAQELLPVDDPDMRRSAIASCSTHSINCGWKRMRAPADLEVLGYYHSHPDHPAQPSIYDRDHAWPWYSYLIVSVERGTAKDLTCWVLSQEGAEFCPESVEIVA